MKKKAILLTVVILLSVGALAQAQERKLSGTIDVTYLSKYIWRGFDVYDDDHSAIQPSIDIDFYDTGFGMSILMSRANQSGFEDDEWWIYTLYYKNTAYEDEVYATDYKVGWGYYNFPDSSHKVGDLQEFFASLSWPKICPAGIVPSYTAIYMWSAKSNSERNEELSDDGLGDAEGWLHIFGLGYDLTVPELVPEIPEQVLHLSADLVYNDGVLGVDHDWSHFVFGVSTDIDLGNNLAFCPGVYYQASMEDSVNDDDEAWVGLSLKYKF